MPYIFLRTVIYLRHRKSRFCIGLAQCATLPGGFLEIAALIEENRKIDLMNVVEKDMSSLMVFALCLLECSAEK